MGFFHPERLLWGLAAIVVLLLYLSRRGPRVDVSSHLLWQRALARRGPGRRFQRPLSAVVLCLIVCLLAGALAEPYRRSDVDSARNIVVVLDTSASMKATDIPGGRFRLAHEQALQLVDDLHLYEQMALITAGGQTRLMCGWTADRRTLREAIDDCENTDAPGAMDSAIDLARWMLSGRPNPRIIVLSDGSFSDRAKLTSADDVTLVTPWIGQPQPVKTPTNYAITRLAARRPANGSPGCEILVELANYSPKAATLPLTLSVGDVAVPPRMVPVEANSRTIQTFSLGEMRAGMISAKIDVTDDLSADNVAWLSMAPPIAGPVVIPSQWQTQNSTSTAETQPPAHGNTQGNGIEPRGEVITGDKASSLPRWPVLVLGPTADSVLWRVKGTSPGAVVLRDETGDRVLRQIAAALDLADVVAEESIRLEYTKPPDAVLRAGDGRDIMSLWRRDGSPVVVLHLEPQKCGLARRPGFESRLRAAVEALAKSDVTVEVATTTAEVVHIAPSDQFRVLRGPGGHERLVAPGLTRVGPLTAAGQWHYAVVETTAGSMTATEQPGVAVATSLLDANESDLRVPTELIATKMPVSDAGPQGSPGGWLLLAALGLAGVEWVLFQRRITV